MAYTILYTSSIIYRVNAIELASVMLNVYKFNGSIFHPPFFYPKNKTGWTCFTFRLAIRDFGIASILNEYVVTLTGIYCFECNFFNFLFLNFCLFEK